MIRFLSNNGSAINYFFVKRLHENWILGKKQNCKFSVRFTDCKVLDENWGLFSNSRSVTYPTLFDCHARKLVDVPPITTESIHSNNLLLDSRPGSTPTIVFYNSGTTIYYQKDKRITKQTLPCKVNSGIAIDSNKIFFGTYS